MIQSYSEDYFPPMPVLDVALARPEETNWIGPYPALIDSGADFCIVPTALIRRLRPPLVRQATIYSHWRDARAVAMYTVDMRISEVVQPAVLKITTAEGAKAAKLHKEKPYAPLCALRVLGGINFHRLWCRRHVTCYGGQ